jgi:pimeloyl-ACP methyl ester carboxylesterase
MVNGVRLYFETHGSGEPLALVHGAWSDARTWDRIVPSLAESFRVLVYDRRGHSRSERPAGRGSVDEDGEDLAALLDALDFVPAHVVSHALGGNIALRVSARRPQIVRSLCCHEPPLWNLLEDDRESVDRLRKAATILQAVCDRIAAGDHEGGARQCMEELAYGPGAWENVLSLEDREIFVYNAPTFLDEVQDPDMFRADRDALERVRIPVRATDGSESSPLFTRALARLVAVIPGASRETIQGAAHVPQRQTPERYVEIIRRAMNGAGT